MIDLQSDFVFAKDRQGRFVLANQALADAMGTTVERLVGRREVEVASKTDEVEQFHVADLMVIDSGRELVIPEEPLTHANGALRWLSTVKRPILSPKAETIVLGVSADITVRKAAEDEVRKLNADLERRVRAHRDLHESNRSSIRRGSNRRRRAAPSRRSWPT